MKILAIAGSLRKGSYNRSLIEVAKEVAPSGISIEICDLAPLPLYCQDQEDPLPEAVVQMKQKIEEADAILIATPEYNYSFPGVLKNALDWCSRPYGKSSWTKKRVAIMGASPSPQGTLRAQLELRHVLFGLNMQVLSRPELMVPLAHTVFSETGELTDPKLRERVAKLLEALANTVA